MTINFLTAEISAEINSPMEIYFCQLYSGAEHRSSYSVMPVHPFCSGWGIGGGKQIGFLETKPFETLEVAWLSLTECKFYYAEINLERYIFDARRIENDESFENLIIGLARYGNIALWANNGYCSKLVGCCKADEINLSMTDFLEYDYKESVNYYCQKVLAELGYRINLHDDDNFEKRMKQYCYCFKIKSEKPILIKSLQTFYTDGSNNRKNDELAFCFRPASIPEKLNLRFKIETDNYLLSLFFDRLIMYRIFERFYGTHPHTKVDFILNIDTDTMKFEPALYRQGIKEPVAIPESTYNLIMFKNKFEVCRSTNYNQRSGAWIW